jgi:hypothetical protein
VGAVALRRGKQMNFASQNLIAIRKTRSFRKRIAFALLCCLPLPCLALQIGDVVTLDSSDWWSVDREIKPDEAAPQQRILSESNFSVVGVDLGDTMFRSARRKLGQAIIQQRGDGATGRRQICYTSAGSQDKVYVIFEQGEVDYTFYLFTDGPPWQGAERCFQSTAISRRSTTGSGLRLGQSPSQVIDLIGRPTKRSENELLYSFSVKKRTSTKELREARQRNPAMSDKDLQDTYGYYNDASGIVARFVDSKLTYLAVSHIESN